jgi:hypothetical protein
MSRGLVAALLLSLQLGAFALPALCRAAAVREHVGCELPMPAPHGAALVAGGSPHLPCANPALCGVAAPASPTTLLPGLAVISSERAAFFVVAPLHPGAPRAPVPPPPQA